MGARYKFVCISCKYQCICGIGTEAGPQSSEVAMVCSSCAEVDVYTIPNLGNINTELSRMPACQHCGSVDYLKLWDGLTCPHCNKHMRAIGSPVGTKRPFKYW